MPVVDDVVHNAGCIDRHMAEPEGSICICIQGQGRDPGFDRSPRLVGLLIDWIGGVNFTESDGAH